MKYLLFATLMLTGCDPDYDNNGVPDTIDNCPALQESNQRDKDNDGYGDACDSCPEGGYLTTYQKADYCPGSNTCCGGK